MSPVGRFYFVRLKMPLLLTSPSALILVSTYNRLYLVANILDMMLVCSSGCVEIFCCQTDTPGYEACIAHAPLISFIVLSTISIFITPGSGTNTAGEIYRLECSVTVNGTSDQPNIVWLDPVNNPVPSEMITTTGHMSTLAFDPLAASHAGTYMCS